MEPVTPHRKMRDEKSIKLLVRVCSHSNFGFHITGYRISPPVVNFSIVPLLVWHRQSTNFDLTQTFMKRCCNAITKTSPNLGGSTQAAPFVLLLHLQNRFQWSNMIKSYEIVNSLSRRTITIQTSLHIWLFRYSFTISQVSQPPENLMLLAVRGLAEPNRGLWNFETTFDLLDYQIFKNPSFPGIRTLQPIKWIHHIE